MNLLSGGSRGIHGNFRAMLRPFRRPSGLTAFTVTTNFLRGLAQLAFVVVIMGAIFVAGGVALLLVQGEEGVASGG